MAQRRTSPRIDLLSLIHVYCAATSIQASIDDYTTGASGRRPGFVPGFRYEGIDFLGLRMRAWLSSSRLPPGWRSNASGIAMLSTTTSSIRCSSHWPYTRAAPRGRARRRPRHRLVAHLPRRVPGGRPHRHARLPSDAAASACADGLRSPGRSCSASSAPAAPCSGSTRVSTAARSPRRSFSISRRTRMCGA